MRARVSVEGRGKGKETRIAMLITRGTPSNAVELWADVKDGSLKVRMAEVDSAHAGKRLGMSAYEAAIAHTMQAHGATHVEGNTHSTLAHRTHKRLSEKWGWDYKGELYPDKVDVEPAPFDGRYKAYKYRIK